MKYVPYNPGSKPRAPKLSKYKTVHRTKAIKAKNVAAIYREAKVISEANGIPLDKIVARPYYGGVDLVWSSPETDKEFKARSTRTLRDHNSRVNAWKRQKKEYDKWKQESDLADIGKSVTAHEAAIGTIAEVLIKYPDVLDKAIAKAVKGKK